jgi:hypothetical protein
LANNEELGGKAAVCAIMLMKEEAHNIVLAMPLLCLLPTPSLTHCRPACSHRHRAGALPLALMHLCWAPPRGRETGFDFCLASAPPTRPSLEGLVVGAHLFGARSPAHLPCNQRWTQEFIEA